MPKTVISVEHLSKSYRLGQIGTGTLTNDMKVWFARKMGKPNPLLKIGQTDHGNVEGETLWALKDVNFTVEQGEVLGIIGRNGAGKSTLLKILSRVTAPTSGLVKVKGRIASLLEVGTGFHPDLTGRENIYLNGAILGMTRQEIARKFDEIVDFAEIEKFIDTPVKRYSSGMYVRLAFAVAAHLESEILLVDEVLAVGDAEFQKKCLGKMGDVASKEGRTVLFVSHNMNAISSLTANSILLSGGTIIFYGSTTETITRYVGTHMSHSSIYEANPSPTKATITRIELNTTYPNNVQLSEKPFIINIEIYNPFIIEDTRLSVQVMDKNNTSIAYFWNFVHKKSMPLDKGNHIFLCKIPSLHLNSGRYSLTVHLSEGNGKRKLQLIEFACPFTVHLDKTYLAGNWRPDFCTYLEDFTWEHIRKS